MPSLSEIYKYILYKNIYESPAKITTIDKLPETGFASVYMYDKSIIDYYTTTGALRGYVSTVPVCYSNRLLVDFDNEKEAATDFYQRLKEENIGFKVYDSGGRSIHFHVDREEQASEHLPYSDKRFMENCAPKADMSLYQVGRVFRLTGTTHHNTGKKKILIESFIGNKITIPLVDKPPVVYQSPDVDYKKVFDDPIVYASFMGFSAGERESSMFKLITHLKDYGISIEFIEEFLRCVNAQCTPPLDDERIDYLMRYYVGK